MTGSRFPGSRVVTSDHLPRELANPQWHVWSSAIRLQLPGQPRNCLPEQTDRIPLDSPCGHHRPRTWRLAMIASTLYRAEDIRRRQETKSILARRAILARLPTFRQVFAGGMDDKPMPHSKTPTWREDIDALAFQPADHGGVCMVHRRAFRTLLRTIPSPQQCVDFYRAHQDAFQAAARAKLVRADVADTANFTSPARDVIRQLKN